VAVSLFNLANALRNSGSYNQAQNYYEEALSIQQMAGNRWEEVNICNSLGIFYQEVGDYSKAVASLKRGLALAREIGDEIGVAYLMDNLSLVAYETEDFDAAESYQREGLEIARQHHETQLVSNYLYHLSLTRFQLGDLGQAAQYAHDSLALRRELDIRLATTGNLAILGKIFAANSNLTQALDFCTQALSILDDCRGEGPEFPQLDYLMCYQVFLAAGQTAQAQAALKAAHHLVAARAEKITQPTLRQSFLENVHTNREVMAAYRAMTDEPPDRQVLCN
jgi:tetratricopeptide (TPR) repeat protein